MKTHYLGSLLIVFLSISAMVGCNNPGQFTLDPPDTGQEPTVQATHLQNPTVQVSTPNSNNSPIQVEPTLPSFFQVETLPEDSRIRVHCLEETANLSGKEILEGTVLVTTKPPSINLALIDLGSNSIKTTMVTHEGEVTDVSLSPDHKNYSYINKNSIEDDKERNQELLLATGVGVIVKKVNLDPSWYSPRWVNPEEILFTIWEEAVGTTGTPYPPTLMMLNIITGRTEVYQPDYPDMLIIRNIYWNNDGITAYNADFSRLVYAANKAGEPSYVLWDTVFQRQIADIPTGGYLPDAAPVWNADGDKFLLVLRTTNSHELYLVNEAGEISQLTNLASLFQPGYRIDDYTWAADGKKIAFYVSPYNNETTTWQNPQLAIYDFPSGKLSFVCFTPYSFNNEHQIVKDLPSKLIWSPDSTMLLTTRITGSNTNQLVIIHVIQKVVIEIGEDYNPVGWLVHSGPN